MSQVKKTKEKAKFSKLRLRSTTNKSKTLNSPRPSEKISSYFSSVLNETNLNSQLENDTQNTESQKNNNLPTPSDNEDDFKETKTQKPAKMFQIKSHKEVKNTKKPPRSKKAVSTFGKNVIVEPGCSDTNQEHLQLAMAMSKSLDEIENPNRNTVDSIESNNSFPSTQEKITKIRSTLDQFGFKSNKSITDLPPRQKSIRKKFKYITPTLYIRTDADRTKIIENKVSEIIENIAIYNKNISKTSSEDEIETEINSNKPKSFKLREYYNEDAVLFRKNGLSCSEMSQKLFYNGTVAPSDVKVGVLLKDWNSIPGREKTPPLPDTKENMNQQINENNRSLSPKLNSETLLSENTNYHKSNSPTIISLRTMKSPPLHIETPNIHLSSQSPSPEFKIKSEFIEHTSNIHQLHVTSPINRSITPDLFSDSDLDTEILMNENKKNNSPLINIKKNTQSPCQIISSNDSSSFSCDTVLLSSKTNLSQLFTKNKNLSPFQEISSNGSSNFSIETKILSPKKQSTKTISPLFNKKNNLCSPLQEISSTDSSNFSRDTKLLSPKKINKNNISPVVKAENILNVDEENSNGNSSHFSCETVLLYPNKNSLSPFQDNDSNASTFSCETKHLSDQSDANSVSLLEISPHKNKIKKSPKSPSSCKKNLFESISLLDISPHKNKTKKAKKSANLARKSILDDIKPLKSTTNMNDLAGNSKNKNCKKSPTLENSRIDVSAEDKDIFHFESSCDNSNDCFDLTQSSDDSTHVRFNKSIGKLIQDNEQASNRILFVPETSDILNTTHQDKCKMSKNNLNCSVNNDELMSVSQLINASLIENNKHNNDDDAIDLTQSPTESIASYKINDTDKIESKIGLQNTIIKRKKSDEAEIENHIFDTNFISSSNTGTKSFKVNDQKNTEFIAPITSPGEFCYNKLYDEDINIISFFGHVNRNEISRHRSFDYKNKDSSQILDNNINQNLDYNSPKSTKTNNSILDQTISTNKSKRNSLRRSFSEKIIRNKEFNYISPKSSKDNSSLKLISPVEKLFQSQTCRKNNSARLVNKFGDKNKLSSKEMKPKCLNESFGNTEMSDDELNYSCNKRNLNKSNKSFVRFESEKEMLSKSGDSIEISDEELNYSCNKIENYKSKLSTKIDSQEKQNKNEDDDDVQVLSQCSVDELDEIENTSRNLLIASPPSEKEEENVDDVQFLSQSSIEACSDISDEELNYSCNTPYKRKKANKKLSETKDKYVREEENDVGNVIDRSLNIEANVIDFNDLPCNEYQHSDSLFGSYYYELNSTPIPTRKTPSINDTRCSEVLKHPRVANLYTPTSNKVRKSCSQLDDTFDNIVKKKGIFDKITDVDSHENSVVKTPENAKRGDEPIITPNSAIIIKTTNVTPMPKYNDMDTPQRNKELEKFGLKAMKRAKGVKILQYIYDATHPITGAEKIHKSSSEDEDNRIIKRRKKNTMDENSEAGSSKNSGGIKRKSSNNEIFNDNKIDGKIEILGNKIAESESVKDMIFERTFSSRIASCRLPLHIAWHNFVSSQPDLHEKILLYEPLQIEDIYAKFKSFGLKYHVQDLIAFLDRKCITIRIAQTNRKKKTRKSPKGK